MSLRKESVLANDIKLSEINRRCRLEAELEAIRVYVDYTQHKKAEKMRNKEVQTDTSIPANLNFDSIKPSSPFKKIASSTNSKSTTPSKSYSNFKALESATSLWKTKHAEQEFQKQTKIMKHRFMTSTSRSTDREYDSHQDELLKISSAQKHRRYSYPAEELVASSGSQIENQHQKQSMDLFNNGGYKESNNFKVKCISSPPMSPSKSMQFIKSNYFQHPTATHPTILPNYAKSKA